MTETGTLFAVVQWPAPWPPVRRVLLVNIEQRGMSGSVIGKPDGRLAFGLCGPDGAPQKMVSVPIQASGEGLALFCCQWEANKPILLRLNGEEIPESDENEEPVILRLGENPGDRAPAIGHPDADDVCQDRVEERTDRWGTPATIRKADTHYLRVKTLEEQTQELRSALGGLNMLRQVVRESSGRVGIDALAAMLRGLLYWKESESTSYNPLLLRLAARCNPPLPLPVWAVTSDDASAPDVIQEADLRYQTFVSPVRLVTTQELMDLQDWLGQRVSTERLDGKTAEAIGKSQRHLTARQIIHKVASEQGAAHWSEKVRKDVDRLKSVSGNRGDGVWNLIDQLVGVTLPLGNYVLKNLPERGGEA